jgi:hypothetical protein
MVDFQGISVGTSGTAKPALRSVDPYLSRCFFVHHAYFSRQKISSGLARFGL